MKKKPGHFKKELCHSKKKPDPFNKKPGNFKKKPGHLKKKPGHLKKKPSPNPKLLTAKLEGGTNSRPRIRPQQLCCYFTLSLLFYLSYPQRSYSLCSYLASGGKQECLINSSFCQITYWFD